MRVTGVGTGVERHDVAVLDREDAVGHRRDLRAVGHEHQAAAGLARDAVEERHHLLAGRVVEVAGGLVGEEEPRVLHEGAGDRDALLLAARQAVGEGPLAALEGHFGEERAGPRGGVLRRAPAELGRQLHVLEDGEGRDEVEELEDEAEVVAAEEGPPGGGEAAEAGARHPDLARGGGVDAGHEVEQRALAAAAAAPDRHDLAFGELDGRLAQHVAGLLALAVVLADAVESDDRGARHESR